MEAVGGDGLPGSLRLRRGLAAPAQCGVNPAAWGCPQIKTPGGEPGVFICLGELLTMRKDGFLCGINSP